MKFLVLLSFVVACVNAANLDALAKPAFSNGRIINGQEAKKGEAPFIVSLQVRSHFCSGSILNEHWILTAAHCFIYKNFKVVAGLHSRNDQSNAQIRSVTRTIAHEEYGSGVGPFDIGLIYIDEPFVFYVGGPNPVDKIALPSGNSLLTGDGKLYGWGIDNTGVLPNKLQSLDTNIINYNTCMKALPPNAPIDRNSNICSYKAGTTDGPCGGDSGGPLVKFTINGVVIVGIVSWGYVPCNRTKYPSVYTNTRTFINWINDKINNSNFN